MCGTHLLCMMTACVHLVRILMSRFRVRREAFDLCWLRTGGQAVATRSGQGRLDFRRRARGFLRSASSAARRRSLCRGARPSRHLFAPNLFFPVVSRLALTSRRSADRARALSAGGDARARARGMHPRPIGGALAARRGRRRAAAVAESARVDVCPHPSCGG